MASSGGVRERLSQGLVLFDGAMGTMLQAQGLPPGDPPEEWVLSRPEVVRGIHAAYSAAGAEVALTATLGTPRLWLHRREGRAWVEEILRRAVEIARSVAPTGGLVLGDLGPTGGLEEAGLRGTGPLRAAYGAIAEVLTRSGVEGILLETYYDLAEATLALREVREASPLPVGVSLAPERVGDGFALRSGERVEQAVRALEEAGASWLGANCIPEGDAMVDLARALRPLTGLPLVFQPGAGRAAFQGGQAVYRVSPAAFAGHLVALADAGANGVGGCCGTTPAHIAEARWALERWGGRPRCGESAVGTR